ncbi:molybdopterin-dependent oxidoreductase [Chachezhania antarctica]|uniref:molybdopterin-dependent oxidoreductase n=1 Tax=Chachezhania antarctica TaxID=2340860 RepID=UPI000EAE84C3|nr:molybdopterin-dependent oxidoreductase [Chachezhania antarctica]|tara:strand:- start:1780 stop:2283 length:504 start_codon:yes stop_codon:yes gene_type:complete
MTRTLPALTLAALLLGTAAFADLPEPTGDVLLTVDGDITETNVGDTAQFDRAMMEAMDPVTITTTTIWTDGEQTFTGVPLSTLMAAVGAGGDVISATAVNDYAVEIPRTDWVDDGPIVAYLNNGEPMSLRDKGPLWMIYPFDSRTEYQSEVIYSRSIWQLDRITVRD